MNTSGPELDIVIPVYNEGENILAVLASLEASLRTPFRVLLCYDREDDTTLAALSRFSSRHFPLLKVKNTSQGVLGAVQSGFAASTAPAILVFPADDDYNAPRLDAMVERFRTGCDIVVASRFVRGGKMLDGPLLKMVLCRAVSDVMHHVLRLPAHDATNGFRLFSRRVIEQIPIETTNGWAFSLELLVKCHRLGWKIGEVPVHWYERKKGNSRFRVFHWAPQYLRWVRYALGTAFLGHGPETVQLLSARENKVREVA